MHCLLLQNTFHLRFGLDFLCFNDLFESKYLCVYSFWRFRKRIAFNDDFKYPGVVESSSICSFPPKTFINCTFQGQMQDLRGGGGAG